MPKLTKNQVKSSLLEGRKVVANNWEISINDRDEVVIFPPKGDGFSTTLANLDRAVGDYCKKANTKKPGDRKKSETKVGPDSETQDLIKTPSIKKSPSRSPMKVDMNPGSEDDHPYTPKPTNKSPEAVPAPGGGGMPSMDLGPDSEGNTKWGGRPRIRDTFMDDQAPTEFYRELKAKKPSAELLRDITNEKKWIANTHVAVTPEGWEKTVKKMKDNPDIDNPYALANWMENEGYEPGGKDKKKSLKRHRAGPKLREKWDDSGSYHRDIEAESPEELHALTRAFGGEEVDWSGFRKAPVEAEESMDDVVKEAASDCMKESEMDMEAVDEKAKDYYDKYFEQADSDYGKQLTKDDVTDKRKRDRKKDKKAQMDETDYIRDLLESWVGDNLMLVASEVLGGSGNNELLEAFYSELAPEDREALNKVIKSYQASKKAQAAPMPPQKQPAAPQAAPASPGVPAAAPAAPAPGGAPPAPGGQKPAAPGAEMKPGTGDAGLQALGWTPEDIQLLDEEDKQKILQVQLSKPGTKAPKAPGVPPKGAPPAAPGGQPAPVAPAAPAPQKQVPAPVARRMAQEILNKIQFKKVTRILTGQEVVPTEEPIAPPPAAPNQGAMPEFQSEQEGGDIEQQAWGILAQVQQMPVPASTPESVVTLKIQELNRRLATEVGMSMTEAMSLFLGDAKASPKKLFEK